MVSDFLSKLSTCIILSAVLVFGQHFSGRVGASNDGNQHDPDDIGSAAWEVGIYFKAGAQYVHHDYADHLGNNDPVMEARIHHSVIGAAQRFYNDTTMCFNDQTNLSGAIANIAKQINASSATDNFFLICCGPMEVPWRGIMASDSMKRKYCVCVSHSGWNDTHSDTPEMTHRWTDIQKTGVNCIHITDQNINLQVNDLARWAWAKNSSDPNTRFLDSVRVGGDISDAGMAFFVVTGMGDQLGTPEKLNLLFSQTSSAASFFASVAPLSRNSATAFDELKVFDIRGRLVERFTFKGKMPFENITRTRHAGSYVTIFCRGGSVGTIKRTCNPAR
jgi:hypothetical protein